MRYWLLFICFINGVAFAQKVYRLEIKISDNNEPISRIEVNKLPLDSILVYSEAQKAIAQLQTQGFLLAEVEDIQFVQQKALVKIIRGSRYKLGRLALGNVSKEALSATGYLEKDLTDRDLNPAVLQKLFQELLHFYENNGYPFASVHIDDLIFNERQVSGTLKVTTFEKFAFDSLMVVGNGKVNPRFLQTYLKMRQGMSYSEERILNVNNRLQDLPYLKPVKPPEVQFSNGDASVAVFVDRKNANQFDGILGLQQNGGTGKTELVGNLKLRLQNSLKRGELIQLNYQGLANQSQLLNLGFDLPNVLSTDFGIAPMLDIYKQDTTFLNLDARLSVSYLFGGFNTLRFFIENKSTNLIATQQYSTALSLPPVLDATTISYGLGFNLEKLNYRFNPRKGYTVNLEASAGSKRIKLNAAINPILYNNIALTSNAYRFIGKLSYYKSLSQNVVLVLSNETAGLSTKNVLNNELFRIGGQRSLRGFNEMSILATAYSYANADLRYIIGENAFLFGFYNQGFVQYQTELVNEEDWPLGFGAGMNFETGIGILSITYALGKQQNNPINLRQGKIHFGLVALF